MFSGAYGPGVITGGYLLCGQLLHLGAEVTGGPLPPAVSSTKYSKPSLEGRQLPVQSSLGERGVDLEAYEQCTSQSGTTRQGLGPSKATALHYFGQTL